MRLLLFLLFLWTFQTYFVYTDSGGIEGELSWTSVDFPELFCFLFVSGMSHWFISLISLLSDVDIPGPPFQVLLEATFK